MFMQLLTWLGKPSAFAWVGVLFVRGLATLTGLAILLMTYIDRGFDVLDAIAHHVTARPRGLLHLFNPSVLEVKLKILCNFF